MVEAARLFRKRSGRINVRLADSDALSVQGAFKVETYEKEGLTKLSLSIIADHVLALRQPARKKADAGYAGRREMSFDDSVPF
jgi:hypothetical protein